MAQINITLNQEEILQLLATDREDAFKDLLSTSLNSVLQAESSEQIQAGRYERSEDRQDSRNGFRDRPLTTRIGTIILHVPRHRNTPFETMVFDNYVRSEQALISTMAEMCVEGVSTRKVTKVMETLCDQSYSKSTVSNVCKQLDSAVAEFRQRPLDKEYPFVIIDATYFKTRENHRIISDYMDVAEKSMKCLDEGFDAAMTVMTLPINIRRPFRTSNYLERLNKELKRRSNVIGIFPNAGSIIRLMGSVLMERQEHFQGMRKLFYKTDYNKLELIIDDLERIAVGQQLLLQAA